MKIRAGERNIALRLDAFGSQDCKVSGFCILKRQTARHCKNLQIMVTTGYLDIIKSSERYGLTGSNLVRRERKAVCSKQVNVNVTFWQCQVESSGSIFSFFGQKHVCFIHLRIILETSAFQHEENKLYWNI